MWKMLQAEISYNRRLLYGMLGLMLPLSAFEILVKDVLGYMVLFIMLVLLQSWVGTRNKERRALQQAQLLVAAWRWRGFSL